MNTMMSCRGEGGGREGTEEGRKTERGGKEGGRERERQRQREREREREREKGVSECMNPHKSQSFKQIKLLTYMYIVRSLRT